MNLENGSTAKADIKVEGNVTHIFIWKGTSSFLYSLEYDQASNKYKPWSLRSTRVGVTLDGGVNTATIDIDRTGRMCLASDCNANMNVRWSDAPFSTWSPPISLLGGTFKSDICQVIALPEINKIGVFWSNKNTKKYGFRTHLDVEDPAIWSADEAPGAASALNTGGGFADNQIHLKASQNGTLYSTIKTNYNTSFNTLGYPQVQLLVRRPDGTWENPYPVTYNEGTNPIVLLNESENKLKLFIHWPATVVVFLTRKPYSLTFPLASHLF